MCTTSYSTMSHFPAWQLPPVESFLDPAVAAAVWPKDIYERPDFVTQTTAQRQLVERYQKVMATLPANCTVTDAIAVGVVTEQAAAALFNCLVDYLQEDEAYRRIILYLPFALTSPLHGMSVSPKLTKASERFQHAYRAAFNAQLLVHEVRANFVDGNILEVELRNGHDHERVVKAAHLIPGLIQSGHLTFTEVVQLAADSKDARLKDSVIASCRVLLDLQLITEHDFGKLFSSSDQQQATVGLLQSQPAHQAATASESIGHIMRELQTAVVTAYGLKPADSTPNRTAWLRKAAIANAITQAAAKLANAIGQGVQLPLAEACSTIELRACIDAIRRSGLHDRTVVDTYMNWLADVERTTVDTDVRDALTKLWRHLHAVGNVTDEVLTMRGLRTPALAGPFSRNLEHFVPSVGMVTELTEQVAQHPFLGNRVYPVVLILGSQLKGYGIGDADADVAVFVKPTVSSADEAELHTHLREVFSHKRIGGGVLVFWLNDVAGQLVVQKNTQTKPAPALPTWAHVLLDSAWIGDEAAVLQLRQALLTPYLFGADAEIDGWPARYRWLEELERDAILYRLLHKGYERFYPINSPMDTLHGAAIDGVSAFYDPQFRHIATQLFLTRVFLPNLNPAPR